MIATGLLLMTLLPAAAGCGSQPQNVQGNIGMAGETTQGSAGTSTDNTTQNEQDTMQNSQTTADNTAQAGVSQNTQSADNTNTDNTAQAGVSQNTQSTDNTNTNNSAQTTTQAGSYAMVSDGITEQEAKNIAVTNAGITESDIQYITVKQDWDDGRARYDVEFAAAGVEYDYELDATDGRILSVDSEVLDKGYSAGTSDSTANTGFTQNGTGTAQNTTGGISIETAKQTVMDRIPGIASGNIYIHSDYDDGMYLYEGEAYHAEIKYEFEINAANGSIISWEAESIYD